MSDQLCIVCNTSDDNSSSMNIKINDSQVTVWLCSEHAETTTIKTARTICQARLAVQAIIEDARAEGIELDIPIVAIAGQNAVATPRIQISGPATVVAPPRPAPPRPTSPVVQDPLLEDVNAQVEEQTIRAANGDKTQVPSRVTDQYGTTLVAVKKKKDSDLFRARAEDDPVQFSQNYNLRPCAMCRGDGAIRNKNQDALCPKCNGSGLAS